MSKILIKKGVFTILKKKLKFVILFILITMFTINVNAENLYYSGELECGIYNKKYYNSLYNQNLANQLNGAIADWNYAINSSNNGNGVDFYFTESDTNNWNCRIKAWGATLYNPNANAGVELYDSAGNKITSQAAVATSSPNVQTHNWSHVNILISQNYLDSLTSSGNYTPLRRTLCHEIGHAIGLAHREDNGTIMYPYYNGRTATVPTGADVRAAIAKYSN